MHATIVALLPSGQESETQRRKGNSEKTRAEATTQLQIVISAHLKGEGEYL